MLCSIEREEREREGALLADTLCAGGLHARFRDGVCERGGSKLLCGRGPGAFGVQEEFEAVGEQGGSGGLYAGGVLGGI